MTDHLAMSAMPDKHMAKMASGEMRYFFNMS